MTDFSYKKRQECEILL